MGGSDKHKPVGNKIKKEKIDIDDYELKVADKSKPNMSSNTYTAQVQPLNEEPGWKALKRKAELPNLVLSNESERMIFDTLKKIHGENFSLRDRSTYKDQGGNLSRHYWMNRGNLVVQGGINFSSKSGVVSKNINEFAMNKLEGYGFHRNHCIEAMEAAGNDVGQALDVLVNQYFQIGLRLPVLTHVISDDPDTNCLSEEEKFRVFCERDDEKNVLKSIYEDLFEERIVNRVWILKLKLDYLLDVFKSDKDKVISSDCDNSENVKSDRKQKTPEVCKFFLKGCCKYAQLCRFSHHLPEPKVVNRKEEKIDHFFNLEIRFPEGSRYPLEPPLVCISTTASHFPSVACLRLTSALMKQAEICAADEIPCVYTLGQMLLENSEDMIALVSGNEVFLKENCSLFPQPCSSSDDVPEKEDSIEVKETGGFQFQRIKATLEELSREDKQIACNFSEMQQNSKYQTMKSTRQKLPAWGKCQEILKFIKENQVLIISGETGCGKSTQIPQFILDDWLLNWKSSKSHTEIICTQPRRLSTIGVAERVAEERLEKIGSTVGYQIRLESKMSSSTRLLFCTTGILLKRLEGDPNLVNVSHIIVDEVHERTEQSDFLLMILRDILPVRPDLKVILMSATLNSELFRNYFNRAPNVEIPGRNFPVERYFLEDILDETNYALEENSMYARKMKKGFSEFEQLEVDLELGDIKGAANIIPNPKTRDEDLTIQQICHRYRDYNKLTCKTLYMMDLDKINYDLIEAVLLWIVNGEHAHPKTGSILVFLPGLAEISTLHDHLNDHPLLSPRNGKFFLLPLHSSLTSEEQALVFKKTPHGVRKIILSTNIAETSITIDDCVFVIDCGKMREKRFDSNKNMESLDLVWESRANALQRLGRAGRVMAGVAVHLFTHHKFSMSFLAQPIPELQRVPLEQLLLTIKILPNFAMKSVHQVLENCLEPPTKENIDSALVRLQDVGALDKNMELTPLGCHLAALPVDVRIGKLLLFGAIFCCVDSALTIASCLSYKTPFVSSFGKKDFCDSKRKDFATASSDQLTVLKAYMGWLKASNSSRFAGHCFCQENSMSSRTLLTLVDIKHQLLDLLSSIGFVPAASKYRRNGVDKVFEFTGEELNKNGENQKLLASILCAALYPNVVKVLTPEKLFAPGITGAVPKQIKSEDIKFVTRDNECVHIHPSSINFTETYFPSPYLVYQEKVKTSRIFIRDCSVVPVLPLILFSGSGLQVELHQQRFIIALDDGWIKFAVESHTVAELLQSIRNELIKLLAEKIKDPSINLFHEHGRKVISTIIHLVTQEGR